MPVTSTNPSIGGPSGGSQISVFGSGLTGATQVNIGGVAATSVVVVNDNEITCNLPAHSPGVVDVEVVGVGTGVGIFTYDNVDWSTVSIGYGGTGDFRDSTYIPGVGFVFVGDTGLIYTSVNGTAWTARTSPGAGTQNWKAVGYSPALTRLVIVGFNVVATSDDGGATWTLRTAAEANLWTSVCWSPSLNLFCAVASGGTNRVMTSPDGITWTAHAAAVAKSWQGVCWHASIALFVAVALAAGATNDVMTSPDGSTWTSRTTNLVANTIWGGAGKPIISSDVLGAVAYGSYGDIVGGGSTTTPVRLERSTDAITWVHASIPGSLRPERPVDAPALGVVMGTIQPGGTYIKSPDGITWTQTNIPFPPVTFMGDFCACWADDIHVLVATNNGHADKMMRGVWTISVVGLTLTAVDPITGLTTGGTAVTLTGTGFVSGILVNFDNISATSIVVVSDTEITCVTPAHDLGLVDVTVTIPDTGEFATLTDGYEYVNAGISSLDPNHGPMAGGTTVTIHGAGFITGEPITFDGLSATSITFVNSSTYTCVTPPHSEGLVEVKLGTDFTGEYTYDPLIVDPWQPPDGGGGGVGAAGIRRNPDVTINRTKNQPGTSTFEIGKAGTRPLAGQIIVVDLTEGPIFEGPALMVAISFEEESTHLKSHIDVADYAWILNARRPFGSWTKNTSATDVILDIMAFAPGFTTTFVVSGLPVIVDDLVLNGDQIITECLDTISKLAADPIHWYLDGKDLHYFETEVTTAPDLITDALPTLLKDPPVTLTEDVSQIRNRIFGKGVGSQVVIGASPGQTVLEVVDIQPFDTPGGGLAIVQGQVISYTGVRRQAESVTRQPPRLVPAPGGSNDLRAETIELNARVDGPIRDSVLYRMSTVDGMGVESELGPPFGEFGLTSVVDGIVYNSSLTWTQNPQVPELLMQGWFQGITTAPFTASDIGGDDFVEDDGFVESGTYRYIFTFKTAGGGETSGNIPSSTEGQHVVTVPFSTVGGLHPGRFSVRLRLHANIPFDGGAWDGFPNPNQRITKLGIYRSKGGQSTNLQPEITIPGSGQRRFYSIGELDLTAGSTDWQFGDLGTSRVFTFVDRLSDLSLSNENESIEFRSALNPKDGTFKYVFPTNTTGGQVRLINLPIIDNINDWDVPTGDIQVQDPAPFGATSIVAVKTGAPATFGAGNLMEIEGAGTYTVAFSVVIGGGGAVLVFSPPLRIDLNGSETITLHPPSRKIYRAQKNNPDAWKLLTTINDNSTTEYIDATPTLPPNIEDQTGGELPDDPDGGGQPPPGLLPPIIHYVLIGIPAEGVHSIQRPIIDGAEVNIWEQYDDVDAQIFLAGRQGGSGIREITINDTSLKRPALRDRIRAEAALFSMPIFTVNYATRDQKTREGRTVEFNLVSPPIVGSFLIQTVVENEIHAEGGASPQLLPKLIVTASSVRFTLEDLLDRALLASDIGSSGGGGGGFSSRATAPEPHKFTAVATDPNIVITVTGRPERALLAETDLVLSWQGQLSPSRGGTGTDASGVTDGQILIGRTSDHTFQRASIVPGSGIIITPGAGSLQIDATGAVSTYSSILTNGDPTAPEIVFDSFGDVIVVMVPL